MDKNVIRYGIVGNAEYIKIYNRLMEHFDIDDYVLTVNTKIPAVDPVTYEWIPDKIMFYLGVRIEFKNEENTALYKLKWM